MHVHLTEDDIRRHPWIGILIGLAGLILMAFVTFIAVRDYISFSKQKSPEVIDVEGLEPNSIHMRRWVTLANAQFLCDQVEQLIRTDPLEKLISGPAYSTYIPITNSAGQVLVIAVFNGDATCAQVENQPVVGILTTLDDHSYGLGYSSTRLSKTTNTRVILFADKEPRPTKLELIMVPFFSVMSLLLIVRSIRLGREFRQKRSDVFIN